MPALVLTVDDERRYRGAHAWPHLSVRVYAHVHTDAYTHLHIGVHTHPYMCTDSSPYTCAHSSLYAFPHTRLYTWYMRMSIRMPMSMPVKMSVGMSVRVPQWSSHRGADCILASCFFFRFLFFPFVCAARCPRAHTDSFSFHAATATRHPPRSKI